jgi:hypothetical protein
MPKKRLTLEEIGVVLKRDGSTLSRLRDRFLLKLGTCDKLKQKVEKLKQNVSN